MDNFNINKGEFNPLAFVHSPAQAGNVLIEHAEYIQKTPGSTWGVPIIDKVVIPERPGEVIGIMGRPGDGKTTLQIFRARQEAQAIANNPSRQGEIVVFVAWEGTVESLEPKFFADPQINATDIAWGRADLDLLNERVIKQRNKLPVWIIGHSARQRAMMGRDVRKVPPLTPELVVECIESAYTHWEEAITKVSLLVFDYAQAAPSQRPMKRFDRIAEIPHAIEDVAKRMGCPAIMGIQANRRVDEYEIKLATLHDCDGSSELEKVCAKLFSIWRPWNLERSKWVHKGSEVITYPDGFKAIPGADFQAFGRNVELSERMLWMRMIKQRDDSSAFSWVLDFNPTTLELRPHPVMLR